jgi:hypothetical protein
MADSQKIEIWLSPSSKIEEVIIGAKKSSLLRISGKTGTNKTRLGSWNKYLILQCPNNFTNQ